MSNRLLQHTQKGYGAQHVEIWKTGKQNTPEKL